MFESLDIKWLINKFFMEHPEYKYAQGNREVEVESEDDYTDEEYEPDSDYETADDSDLD